MVFCGSTLPLRTADRDPVTASPTHLVDEADGGCLATIQEVHVYDLQLLQADVEGLEFTVVAVQRDDLEQAVIQPQPDHSALRIHNANDARLRGAANAVLTGQTSAMPSQCQSMHTLHIFA